MTRSGPRFCDRSNPRTVRITEPQATVGRVNPFGRSSPIEKANGLRVNINTKADKRQCSSMQATEYEPRGRPYKSGMTSRGNNGAGTERCLSRINIDQQSFNVVDGLDHII